MNGGIIDRAEKGTKAYSEAEIGEQIKLAYAEWKTAQYTGETRTAADFIKDRLNVTYGENAVTNVTETEGVFTVTFTDGKEYSYNVTTGTTEKVAKWTDNGDNTFTNSETGTKVQIGDIVNYDELSNGTKTYTTDITKGIGGSLGNSGDIDSNGKYVLESKTYTTEDLTWRVLGVNERGQIELFSENPMSDENKVYLANEEGYLYGPEQLDEMCNNLYGNGNGALFARSLSVENVDKLAGIKTYEDKKYCSSIDYLSDYKYRYPNLEEDSTNRNMQCCKGRNSIYDSWRNITGTSYQKFKMPGEPSNTEINSTNPGTSPELKYTYYHYGIWEKIKTKTVDNEYIAVLLSRGTGGKEIDQWLTGRFIICYTDSCAQFGIDHLNGSKGRNPIIFIK